MDKKEKNYTSLLYIKQICIQSISHMYLHKYYADS
jgi:hypothetical protein